MTNPRTTRPSRPPKNYWHESFIYFPRLTIYNKLVWRYCYKRTIETGPGGLLEGTLYNTQYATEKEVFEHKLKNGSQ